MRRNYNPYRHFYQKFKSKIDEQFKTMFDLKKNVCPTLPLELQLITIRTDISDRMTVYRHLKNMCEIVSISDAFTNRVVVDVGVGFGGSYLPIKFGKPKKIIAVDPFEENLEMARKLGYDECHLMGWEDYVFPPASLVFIRANWLPDFELFFKRLKRHNVCDIIIIQHLLPIALDHTYHYMYNQVTEEIVSRWTYNQTIEVTKIPSINEIIRLAELNQFGLCFKKTIHRDGETILKKNDLEIFNNQFTKYILHFSKVGK